MGQNLWAISIAIFCIASLLGALNFIATTLDLRTKGMSLARMPYSSWAWFVTSVIALLAFAVLLPACILLILDRAAGTSFFIPAGLVLSDKTATAFRRFRHCCGSTFSGSLAIPRSISRFCRRSESSCHILPVFARKPCSGRAPLIGCMIAIGFLSYMVWGHHMFVSGMNPFSATLFSVPTLYITIPATILTLLLIGSVYGAKMRFTLRLAVLPGVYLRVHQRRNQRVLFGAAFD